MTTQNLAKEYADSVADQIIDWCNAGYPFGARDDDGEPIELEDIADTDNITKISAYDYMEDILDIEYRVGADCEYRSAELLITCGGPNAYIDTARRALIVHWSGSHTRSLPADFINALDEACEELLNC